MRERIGFALDSRALWIIARVLLASAFLFLGLAKLIDFRGGLLEMRAAGLEPAWLFNVASAIVLTSGAVLIVLDRALWLGSAMLAAFSLLTVLLAHHSGAFQPPGPAKAMYWSLTHLSLLGGLVAVAIASRSRKRLQVALELYCGVLQR
ncbi:DoxX family protein [Pseudomonas nitroreducens]|uniref:DoxX family protein n=1 Tax=Pseudomonas nitroreducens TaxID=46680 RepID=A0A6G6J7W7_PSENT|nr:DoxX family protein [Pseudomonas nitroreducens]QIE91429.1 DoxX family protein [Pseudomonas nitroreducens]